VAGFGQEQQFSGIKACKIVPNSAGWGPGAAVNQEKKRKMTKIKTNLPEIKYKFNCFSRFYCRFSKEGIQLETRVKNS
jgi:hypothetical protein